MGRSWIHSGQPVGPFAFQTVMASHSNAKPIFLDPSGVDVLAPNLKRKLSGVTATVVRLVPVQAREVAIAAVGPTLPAAIPQIRIRDMVLMPRQGPRGARVWHARRNREMIVGLFLKKCLGKNLRLLFTSASQRHHTWITRWLIAEMDEVISTSKATAAYLKRDSVVVHHGIDLDAFSPINDRAALRDRLGLPIDCFLIGCYGRIRAQKGTDVFVDAMRELLSRNPQVTAVVMGRATSGHELFLQELKSRVKAAFLEKRMLFFPEVSVDQMADWYRVLDLFVAPQRWEGFGLTPLEAMACGIPVVATRTGAFEELIIDGECGYLVPPADAKAIAHRCTELLNSESLRKAHAQRGRLHIRKTFSIAFEAQSLNTIYKNLLNSPESTRY